MSGITMNQALGNKGFQCDCRTQVGNGAVYEAFVSASGIANNGTLSLGISVPVGSHAMILHIEVGLFNAASGVEGQFEWRQEGTLAAKTTPVTPLGHQIPAKAGVSIDSDFYQDATMADGTARPVQYFSGVQDADTSPAAERYIDNRDGSVAVECLLTVTNKSGNAADGQIQIIFAEYDKDGS